MIDLKSFEKLLQIALKRLKGEWVLIGGTVNLLVRAGNRSTIDIDLISLKDDSMKTTIELMKIAEECGLPVETVNQAGAFYLQKIPDFRKRLVLHRKSKTMKLYRPMADLYLELKVSRLTESDVQDILNYLDYCKNTEGVDQNRIEEVLAHPNRANLSSAAKKRLRVLRKHIIRR